MSSARKEPPVRKTTSATRDLAAPKTTIAPVPERKRPLALAIALLAYAVWIGFLAWLAWQSLS